MKVAFELKELWLTNVSYFDAYFRLLGGYKVISSPKLLLLLNFYITLAGPTDLELFKNGRTDGTSSSSLTSLYLVFVFPFF
jgi:hypothetical protein